MPRAKVKFSGGVRAGIPVSYESRYAHLVTTLGVSLSASRGFDFGRPDAQGKRWNLALSLGEGFFEGRAHERDPRQLPGLTRRAAARPAPRAARAAPAPPRTIGAAVRSARATPSRPRARSRCRAAATHSRSRSSSSTSSNTRSIPTPISASSPCRTRPDRPQRHHLGDHLGRLRRQRSLRPVRPGSRAISPPSTPATRTCAFVLRLLRSQRQQLHPTARGCDRNPVGGSRMTRLSHL